LIYALKKILGSWDLNLICNENTDIC